MKNKYIKVASYEAKKGKIKKVLLLYSGGLDSSVMLHWIQKEYGVPVSTLTMDIGQQHDNLKAIQEKALKFGASDAIIADIKEEFANDFIAKGIKANACYQGDYHLSTPMNRAVLGKIAVKYAKKVGADCIAHGCTGKGNDQLRIDGSVLTHDPEMKILAPVREWAMDRNDEIKYAKKHGIPVPTTVDSPYSDDDSMWGITWEGGEIENPSQTPVEENFMKTYTFPKNAPDTPEFVEIKFKQGLPVAINNEKLSLAQLIIKLNKIAGKHGVGTTYLLEDRIIGLKSRGVYEQPAAHTIIEGHKMLEKYVCTKTLNELKQKMDVDWGYLCYGGMWYDPSMKAINSFNDEVNKKVSGVVKIKLFKGNLTVVSIKSPNALAYSSFNNKAGYNYNVNCSTGFIEVYTLQTKIANNITSYNSF